MKQIRLIAVIAAAATLSAACTKEMNAPQGQSVSQITASWAKSQTKTVLGEDGTSVLWSPNDAISVFYNGDGLKFTSINSAPKATTMFVSSGTVVIGSTEDYGSTPYLYGIYPYSSDNAQDGVYLTLTVPAVQTAVEGSFGRGAYPSIGRSKDTNIAFYNVCGGIRFTLCQSGIRKIVLMGNSDENLAGKVKVKFAENGKPEVSAIISAQKSVTLTAPDDGEFQTGKWYYISVLPTALDEGFSVEFIKRTDESERGTRSIPTSQEVKRSVFGSIQNLDSGVSFKVGIASLSISPENVLVAPMSATQLSLTVLPSDAQYEWIKWSSSDKTIATVDEDGMVTGKKDGNCTITATSDNGKTASCKVYVYSIPEIVDLGLSVKWRNWNVGASMPWECGTYFAWGDVVGQTWNGSSWSGGGFSTYSAYELDENNNLKPEYDAAHVNLGGTWRMPTQAEQQELIDNCTSTWTSDYIGTGVAGRIFTSNKTGFTDKSIFLPITGYGNYDTRSNSGSRGCYWSSTFYSGTYAWRLYFNSDLVRTNRSELYNGRSVRPVTE